MPESGGLFVTDAETDDLTQFSSTLVHASNSLTAAEDAGYILHGSHSFKVTFGGTSSYAYGTETFASQTEIYSRIYFKIDTLSLADNEYMILLTFDDSGGNMVMQFRIYGTGTAGQYGYILMSRDNTNFDARVNHRDDNIFGDDTTYYIEMRWKQGNGTGVENLWIDGSDIGGRTGVTNNSYSVTKVYAGAHDYGSIPTAGTVYFDDVKADTSYIGAYAESGALAGTVSVVSSTSSLLPYIYHYLINNVVSGVATIGQTVPYIFRRLLPDAVDIVSSTVGNITQWTYEVLAGAISALSSLYGNLTGSITGSFNKLKIYMKIHRGRF